MHHENVIHRDIKPQNLMRRRQDGKIVLIDFGAVKEISTLVINAAGETTVTVAVGTPGYMPSEQAIGKPKFSSDIYAVGMIGIQALTRKKLHQLPEDMRTGNILWRDQAEVREKLGNIIDKMVRDHFSQRYQDAAEALAALMDVNIEVENESVNRRKAVKKLAKAHKKVADIRADALHKLTTWLAKVRLVPVRSL